MTDAHEAREGDAAASHPSQEGPTGLRKEWPTLALVALCYAGFGWATTHLAGWSVPLAICAVTLTVVLHASLTHEVMHGHPTANRHINAALVFPALSFTVPYMRFRDTHLAHHEDSRLTDPYDDPESNYLDPAVWASLGPLRQGVLRANNTLAGRLTLGPVLGQIAFMRADWALIRAGDRRVLISWLWHVPAAALPLWWLMRFGALPLWGYAAAVYAGLAILKIRTFLEHRAHTLSRGRTVIIEDRGPLAFLFLNNNFHAVHHMHPQICWFDLPALYAARQERFVTINDGYVYRSYGQIFRSYFLRAKDPVPHPLMPAPVPAERTGRPAQP